MSNLLDKYRKIVPSEIIDELFQQAEKIKGNKIIHVSSTKLGGGVAEILTSMIPLTNALGIETEWEIINGTPEFFECTKQFHNALQGDKLTDPNPHLLKIYEQINSENAERLKSVLESGNIIFIHDPQPTALINAFPERKNKWIWRCHIDASNPHAEFWNFLSHYVAQYDASIFSLVDYLQPLPHPTYIIPPSIDPLTEKNIEISSDEIATIYSHFKIDQKRPVIVQVSRFDVFKDPLGVIEAYRLAKKVIPDLQLVLAGGGADDDPEGELVLSNVKIAANDDPYIRILYLPPDSHRTINALQRGADIVLQKSLKEGFGLTVTEALWKKKPVIGGNCGGIRLQVINGLTGFLVNSPEEAAERICYLFQTPELISDMGINGQRLVHDNFLITRHLRDYLNVIISIMNR